jgi:hypothetical protein
MPLAYRTRFYDAAYVAEQDGRAWPDFDWMAVLRASSCFELGRLPFRRYRTEREQVMVDPSPNEIAALEAASPAGGAFLEALGKTDLAALTYDEWMQFIETVVSAFQDKMAELHAPYSVNKSADDPFHGAAS